MSVEDKSIKMLYVLLVIVLVLGIGSAVILEFLIPRDKDPFSTVSFSESQTLPNIVRLGSSYDFEYKIESFENETREYNVNTDLQLFRLYDTTEGLYSCLSPYRRKIYVQWENETNLTHVTIGKLNEIVPDMSIQPDENNIIDWRTYHLSFTAGRAFGIGELVIWFGSHDETKYQFSINAFTKKVYFGGEYIGDVNISRQNDKINIDYDGKNIKFTYNEKVLLDRPLSDGTNGQFGFETRDMFVTLSQMTVYKDENVEVPDRGDVWDYDLDSNMYYTQMENSRQKISRNVYMWRSYINNAEDEELIRQRTETPGVIEDLLNRTPEDTPVTQEITPFECDNPFACNYLRTNNETYFVEGLSLIDLGLSIPQTNYGRRFWLEPRNGTEAAIPWDYFTLEATYDSLYVRDSIMFLFGDKFAIMFTNKSISTLIVNSSGVVVKQYPFFQQRNTTVNGILQDNFTLQAEGKFIHIISGEQDLRIQLNEPLYNISPKILHMNTFSSVRELKIKSSNPSCKKEDFYEFCEIVYNFEGGRVSNTIKPNPEQYGKIILGDNTNIFVGSNNSDLKENNSTYLKENGILSKTIVFNGPLTTIVNKTNFSFIARYKYLDGDGKIKITLYNPDGQTIVSMTSMPKDDAVLIIDNTEVKNKYLRYNYFIKDDIWQEFSIKVYENNISFIHNVTTIASVPATIRSGFFSIITEDTYAELKDVRLEYFSQNMGRRLPLLDDPCRLRLVQHEHIYNETFTLEPNNLKEIKNNFKLDKFFDYGLINVSLNGSSGTNGTPLNIQFWMVRS